MVAHVETGLRDEGRDPTMPRGIRSDRMYNGLIAAIYRGSRLVRRI